MTKIKKLRVIATVRSNAGSERTAQVLSSVDCA
jgi:hypothetical protein